MNNYCVTMTTRLYFSACHGVGAGVQAFMGTHRMFTLNTLKAFTTKYRVPMVTTGMAVNHTGQDSGYELFMRPPLWPAIYSMIKMKGGKVITYVYDSLEGRTASWCSPHRLDDM